MAAGIASRKPFEQVESRTGWLSLLATIPAGAIGILIKPLIQSSFTNPALPSIFLLITAGLLVAGEMFSKQNKDIDDVTWKDSLWIGAFQILSVFPGVSRSGSTIAGGLVRNLKRKTAGQFAFLMAIPIMLAAGIIGIIDMLNIQDLNNFLPVMITGFFTSAVVGYFSISWLLGYIRSHSLLAFAGYCLVFGAGSLAFIYFSPQPSLNNTDLASASLIGIESTTYQIGIDPELEWLVPSINACQQDLEDTAILYQQYANIEDTNERFDAYFTYGQPAAAAGNIYQLGENHLSVIVHPGQSLQLITPSLLNDIFSGRTETWQAAFESCPDCFAGSETAIEGSVEIWTLPEDTFTWRQFDDLYLGSALSSFAHVAPNSKILRLKVSTDINAIGMLPSGWLDDSIRSASVSDASSSDLSLPITVSTSSEPDDLLSLWLTCVQAALANG